MQAQAYSANPKRPRLGDAFRSSRRRALRAVALGTGAATLLVACGRGNKGSSTGLSGAAGSPGKPRSGGQLNMARADDPITFDPATKITDAAKVTSLTNDTLLGFKSGPNVKYTDVIIEPRLAERWETPDAQTYTFLLRKGVKFADLPPVNGRDLTSADIKWSLQYLSRTGQFQKLTPAPSSADFAQLDTIETPDPLTVAVHFKQPFAPFVTYVALEYSPMLAHEIFDEDGDFSKRAVGTGPWQLGMRASQRGQRWVYKKNSAYFLQGLPYIDQVDDLVLHDGATQRAAFLAGQVDVLSSTALDFAAAKQIKKARPDVIQYDFLNPSQTYIYMNVRRPPLDDVRVRKAIALSIDRDEFIKTLANGRGEWAPASSEPGLFTPEEARQLLKYDPAEGRRLVEEAGFATGVEIEFMYPAHKFGEMLITQLQLLQAQLRRAGINLVLKSVDGTTESNRRRSGDYQLATSPRAFLVAGEPDSTLYALYHPASKNNFGRVNDPTLTSLIDAERREQDPLKRRHIWRQAVRRINEVPWATALYFGPGYELWRPYVKNYAPNMAEILIMPIRRAWLEK